MENINVNRRSFIQSALLAGGGLVSSPTGNTSPLPDNPVKSGRSPRRVKIATISQMDIEPYVAGEKMIASVLNAMETASAYKPDIICVPETFSTVGIDENQKSLDWRVETTQMAREKFRKFAAAHQCYVVCPGHIKENGKVYNVAILTDRKGVEVGNYKKAYPTANEIKSGIVPGPLNPPVFDTDFGKIGFQICFDVLWDDGWRQLKEKGAEIVFWPSAYAGGRTVNTRAWQYEYVVVSSTRKHTSKICDISGEEIVKTGFWDPRLAIATVNLEKILIHTWPDVRKFPEIKSRYLDKIKITNFDEEEWSLIESVSPDLTIDTVIREFGLKSRYDYIKASTQLQNSLR